MVIMWKLWITEDEPQNDSQEIFVILIRRILTKKTKKTVHMSHFRLILFDKVFHLILLILATKII